MANKAFQPGCDPRRPTRLIERLTNHLTNSVFVISFGIEDYAENYLLPSNGFLSHLTLDIFTKLLIDVLAICFTVSGKRRRRGDR